MCIWELFFSSKKLFWDLIEGNSNSVLYFSLFKTTVNHLSFLLRDPKRVTWRKKTVFRYISSKNLTQFLQNTPPPLKEFCCSPWQLYIAFSGNLNKNLRHEESKVSQREFILFIKLQRDFSFSVRVSLARNVLLFWPKKVSQRENKSPWGIFKSYQSIHPMSET